jgi:hypothetical protein
MLKTAYKKKLPLICALPVLLMAIGQTPLLHAQTSSKAIELDQLIRLILIPSTASYNVGDWREGSDAQSPINWLHAGIEEAGPKGRVDYGVSYPFVRRGEVVVTVNRKPTHEVLGRRVEPGKWDVTLFGARAGTAALGLSPQSSSHDMPDLMGYFKKKGIVFKHLKCFKEPPISGNEVHSMLVKGYKPVYLQYGWSAGSGGGSQYLHMTSDQRVLDSGCLGE